MKTTTLNILLTVTFCFTISILQAQVAINTDGSAAHPSAMLDVKSNVKGLLIPRMTTPRRGNYVGIGTNTPERNLHVHGDWLTMRLSTGMSGPTLEFVGSATIDWGLSAWNDGFYIISSNNDFEGRTEQFYMNTIMFGPVTPNSKSLGAGTVRWSNVFSVDANFTGILNGNNAILQGYLGVGTPVPARKFEVYGLHRTARISSMDQGASLEFVSASNPDWNISTWFGDLHLSTSTDEFTTNTGEFIFTPSEFRPFSNNTKSLGNPYVSWNQLYASEGFFLSKAGIGTDTPSRTLEVKGPHRTARLSSTEQGSALEFVSASSPSWAISHWSGTLRVNSSTDNFSSSTDRYMFTVDEFRPFSNNALNLGTTTVQWKKLYAIDGYYTGQVGVGTQSPLGKFHVHDAVNENAIMYITPKSSTDNDSATIFLGEDRWGDFGMYWLYDGVGDEIELWGKFATARYGPHLRIKRDNGDVAVGNFFASGYKLSVAGKVICTEVRVEGVGNWPDYVFAGDYHLMCLHDVEQYIQQNQRLPGIPSADDIQSGGFELGDMQRRLLEKVEELTLYAIEQNKRIEQLEQKLAAQEMQARKAKSNRRSHE